jgi:uncharacterized protein
MMGKASRFERPMANRTIVHFEIPAKDPAKLSKFYTKAFGWKFKSAGMEGMPYWTIQTGPTGKSLGGGMYQRMGAGDLPRNYVGVPKIDPAIKQFKAAGGKQVMGKQEIPGIGWSFLGKDPEGNHIAIFQPKR